MVMQVIIVRDEDFSSYYTFYLGIELIGSCKIDEETRYISNFGLDRIYRGYGLGTYILSELIKQNKRPLSLDCNTVRVAFYKRLGFKIIYKDKTFDRYRMELT